MLNYEEFLVYWQKREDMEDKAYGSHSEFTDEQKMQMFEAFRFEGKEGITLEDLDTRHNLEVKMWQER